MGSTGTLIISSFEELKKMEPEMLKKMLIEQMQAKYVNMIAGEAAPAAGAASQAPVGHRAYPEANYKKPDKDQEIKDKQ